MNRKLLAVLLVLCLPACGRTIVKDDAPASDLDVLKANVDRATRPVLLPNGRTYCAELATTEEQQDDCLGDVEDGLFIANGRLESVQQMIHTFIARMKLQRNPCGFWTGLFHRRECSVGE